MYSKWKRSLSLRVKCFSELPVGQIGCAPVPLEAQVRRGLTAHTSPASPPEHLPMPVTPAKNATPFSNLQEGLEEPVEEMVSARLIIYFYLLLYEELGGGGI
jgi:hypothetical protein